MSKLGFHIYGVDADGEIDFRYGRRLTLDIDERVVNVDDATRPLHVSGLQPRDFAVFIGWAGLPEEKTAGSIGYLVSHVDGNDGIIVPGDMVVRSFNTWGSQRISEMAGLIGAGELEQFGLSSLITHTQRQKD